MYIFEAIAVSQLYHLKYVTRIISNVINYQEFSVASVK